MTNLVGAILGAIAAAWLIIAGGLFGALLASVWAVLFLLARTEAALQPTKGRRLAIDSALLLLCLAGGFEGGWYLIPAGGAFVVGDLLGPDSPEVLGLSRRRAAVGFRLLAAALIAGAVATYVYAPLMTAAGSSGPAAATSLFARPGQTLAPLGIGLLTIALAALGAPFLLPVMRGRTRQTVAIAFLLIGFGGALTGSGAALFALPLLCSGLAWQLLPVDEPRATSVLT